MLIGVMGETSVEIVADGVSLGRDDDANLKEVDL